MAMPSNGVPSEPGFDLLAIGAFAWTPHIETAAEICLRNVASGQKVGFAFLDIDMSDDELDPAPILRPWIWALLRPARVAKIRALEDVLRARGVAVVPSAPVAISTGPQTCSDAGVDSIDSLRGFRYKGASLGLGVLSSLIRYAGDISPELKSYRAPADRLLASAVVAFEQTSRLIEELRPAKILVLNGRRATQKGIAEAARLAGIGLLFHEVGATFDRFYLSNRPPQSMENARAMLADIWASAGEHREEIAEKFFLPDRGGMPWRQSWRTIQQRGVTVPGRGLFRIVYFASSIDEYAAVEDGAEAILFDSQRASVEWLVSWVSKRPDAELIIRLHPRMARLSVRERQWWQSQECHNIKLLPAESPVDSYALAETADRIVCYHSSMGPEATYAGLVAILVGDASYRGLDCVYEPRTLSELDRLLTDIELPPKERDNCLPFGYERLMMGEEFEFYQPDSLRTGTLLGQYTAPFESSWSVRTAVKVLYKLDRVGQLAVNPADARAVLGRRIARCSGVRARRGR